MTRPESLLNFFVLLLILTFLTVMRSCRTPDSEINWPTREWSTSTPEEQGMDSEVLAQAFDLIKEQNINVHSIQIVRNGHMVLNACFYPFPDNSIHDMASVTKSVISILTGITIDKGYIPSVDIPVTDIFPEYRISNMDDKKRKLTIRHLLTMTSGYDCTYEGGERQLFKMRGSDDWIQYMLDMPVIYEPGTRFQYCSGNFHLIAGIIKKSAGMSPKDFAEKNLFSALGIEEVVWPADPDGINFGWGDLHLHPTDMAKIGYLCLHNGRWSNKQIVSSTWIEQSSKRTVTLSENEYYGYGWWIRPSPNPGLYETLGRAGQRIIVWSDKNIVVVFTGGGFEPGVIGEFIAKSVKSDSALPENDNAFSSLIKKVKDAQASPDPIPAEDLPRIAYKINGKEYWFANNALDFRKVKLIFVNANEGFFKITREDTTLEIPFGLDNVYRMSQTGELGLLIASRGIWRSDTTLYLDLYHIARMRHDEIGLRFVENRVGIDMEDIHIEGEYRR